MRNFVTPCRVPTPWVRPRWVYFDAVELLSAFMMDGWPNQALFTSTLGGIVERAAVRSPVRIFAEMVTVLWAEGKTRATIRLEELWNELASRHTSPYCVGIRCRAFRIRRTTSHFFRCAHPYESASRLVDSSRTTTRNPLSTSQESKGAAPYSG